MIRILKHFRTKIVGVAMICPDTVPDTLPEIEGEFLWSLDALMSGTLK
jgi:hypothetical protein